MIDHSTVLRRRAFAIGLGVAASLASTQGAMALDGNLPAYEPGAITLDKQKPYIKADGAIRLGGAEHVNFVLEKFDAIFIAKHPGVHFAIETAGTTSAVPLLTHGTVLFGSMGRAINSIEKEAYKKIVGAEPVEIRVAHAANDTSQHLATSLAVYVNRANPLDKLTTKQIAKIFSVGNPGGDFSRWGQLGLDGDWKTQMIHPLGTPEYTGFGNYMQSDQLNGRPLSLQYESLSDTDAILKRLEGDASGIAVAAIGRETNQLKQIAISAGDGKPFTLGTPEDMQAGTYAYGRYLYFYLRKEPGKPLDPVAKDYLRLILSAEGQAIFASQDKGYIPLTPAEVRAELAKLD